MKTLNGTRLGSSARFGKLALHDVEEALVGRGPKKTLHVVLHRLMTCVMQLCRRRLSVVPRRSALTTTRPFPGEVLNRVVNPLQLKFVTLQNSSWVDLDSVDSTLQGRTLLTRTL